MLSCCVFAQADLNIFVSRSWQFYRSKHQRHSLVNSDQTVRLRRACGMNNCKKNANYVHMRKFIFVSAAIKNAVDKKTEYY